MKNKILLRILLLSVCFFVSLSCKKADDTHPEVQTLEIEALSPTKAVLKGNIVKKGSFSVSDHGFIYNMDSYLIQSGGGTKVSLGTSINEGGISKEIQNLVSQNGSRTLYARAYLTNSNGTVYGQTISAQLPAVVTNSIVPANGKAGDHVTLHGQFYTINKDEVSVTFGGINATVIEVTPVKIIVQVPQGINTNNYNNNQVSVTLNVGGQNTTVSYSFKVLPNLKAFSPVSGPVGTVVTITGDNIPNYYYSNTMKVFFGETISSINYNANGIYATVPATLTELKVPISVEFEGIKTTLPGEFTLTPPIVTTISPATGLPGSSFSIFGSNFFNNNYNNNITVTIGGIPASVSHVSTGQINVAIPNNLPAGDYKVVVKSGPFNVEAPQTLKVQALTLSSFSPTSGGVGKEITLQGVFMPNQYYQVYFGSIATNATSISGSTLRAYVPAGATPGDVKLTVKYGSQSADSQDNFTVLAPTISSFSPSSGVAGTVVTINGVGFSPYTYNNAVKFGTVQTNVSGATESTLTVVVPSNLTPGAMKITVVSNGQTIVSSGNFTVTN